MHLKKKKYVFSYSSFLFWGHIIHLNNFFFVCQIKTIIIMPLSARMVGFHCNVSSKKNYLRSRLWYSCTPTSKPLTNDPLYSVTYNSWRLQKYGNCVAVYTSLLRCVQCYSWIFHYNFPLPCVISLILAVFSLTFFFAVMFMALNTHCRSLLMPFIVSVCICIYFIIL